jgi:adenosylmethionine-8-amino-7-oxononanoate aminotransferase
MKLHEHKLFPRDLERDFPLAARGEGVWIWDSNGRRYLDGCSGANVTGIGHGVREIADALADQASRIAYVPPQHFLHEKVLQFADMLIDMAPKGYSRVMLLSGGSEAVENAFKIARQFHVLNGLSSKYRIVSRWRGFHGNTLAADAAGGHTLRRSLYMPMLIPVPHIVPAYCYRCPFDRGYPGCNIDCARDLEKNIIQEEPASISAFCAETMVGAAAAALTPVPEYYKLIREICDRYDVLWIADEVMTGVGRTGSFLAIEKWGVLPDLVVLAKGLSSGYQPLAAILIHDRVFRAFEERGAAFMGGHTYNAHPVTSAAGVAVLNYMKKHRLMESVDGKGKLLREGLKNLAERETLIGNVRGMGLMWGIEFVKNRSTKEPFEPGLNLAKRIMLRAMEEGLLIYPVVGLADGKRGDGALICPPLIINEDEIAVLLDMLADTMKQVRREVGGVT